MNGAQALFKALTDAGVTTCFANPGTSEMQLVYEIGEHAYDSAAIGQSIGLVAFALMLVAAAYECRSETESTTS
jgi:acetolactate synthase-1/2/3 large subunit